MEEINTAPNQPTDLTQSSRASKRKKIIISSIIVLLILIAIAVWRWYSLKNKDMISPQEQLNTLKQTSVYVKPNPVERKNELDELSKQSAPVTTTPEERLNTLNMLKQ